MSNKSPSPFSYYVAS